VDAFADFGKRKKGALYFGRKTWTSLKKSVGLEGGRRLKLVGRKKAS